MKYIFIIHIIFLAIFFIFVGCEGPIGPQGPQGPAGTTTVWVDGSVYANSTYESYGTSYISIYNTMTIPRVMLNSMEYNYDGSFHLDFEPLNPGDEVNITIDGINLDGDSIHTYTNLIVPGPIDLYNESSEDTIYIMLGDDVRFVWNSADNAVLYGFSLYIYYYYNDTSDSYKSYSYRIDTTLSDTSFIIPADSICPNLGEISDIVNTSGNCFISAYNGPIYTGDTTNVYGDGAGFISIIYYSTNYYIETEIDTDRK